MPLTIDIVSGLFTEPKASSPSTQVTVAKKICLLTGRKLALSPAQKGETHLLEAGPGAVERRGGGA